MKSEGNFGVICIPALLIQLVRLTAPITHGRILESVTGALRVKFGERGGGGGARGRKGLGGRERKRERERRKK